MMDAMKVPQAVPPPLRSTIRVGPLIDVVLERQPDPEARKGYHNESCVKVYSKQEGMDERRAQRVPLI